MRSCWRCCARVCARVCVCVQLHVCPIVGHFRPGLSQIPVNSEQSVGAKLFGVQFLPRSLLPLFFVGSPCGFGFVGATSPHTEPPIVRGSPWDPPPRFCVPLKVLLDLLGVLRCELKVCFSVSHQGVHLISSIGPSSVWSFSSWLWTPALSLFPVLFLNPSVQAPGLAVLIAGLGALVSTVGLGKVTRPAGHSHPPRRNLFVNHFYRCTTSDCETLSKHRGISTQVFTVLQFFKLGPSYLVCSPSLCLMCHLAAQLHTGWWSWKALRRNELQSLGSMS